ncbi:MAG: hypothetical protein H6574_01395 [Lewinellaceae bacterium]|nr:hypothetical protein [Saprospiraceae bacterium]MCB9329712.1 hypothetical protein [Lewinellaceae bacterium]
MKNFAVLIALGGVLAGFAIEQFEAFQHVDPICLKEQDCEKKDNSESKKLGSEDKFHPEELPLADSHFLLLSNLQSTLLMQMNIPLSGKFVSILTPPPERV